LRDFEDLSLEQILESISKNTNQSDLIDKIEALIKEPIDLNTSPIKKIAEIPTVSYLIASKVSRLARDGKTIREIAFELSLSDETAWLISKCCYIGEPIKGNSREDYFQSRTRIIEQMNMIRGIWNDKFSGERTDLYQRIKLGVGKFSFGTLLTKDMGEKFKYGFLSGFAVADFGKFKVNLGDFYIKSGMGNILWNINDMGKTSDVISPSNQFANNSFSYSSASEYGFLRGGAFTGEIDIGQERALNIIGWVSRTPRSGTINTSNDTATTIYEMGLFRTENEISKMNKIIEGTYGGNVNLKSGNLIVGISGISINYDKVVMSESSKYFSGKSGFYGSVFGMLTFKDYGLSTEFSRDPNGNMAVKLAGQLKKQDYEAALHGRLFSEKFRAPFGYIFGEASNPANEYGVYGGLVYTGFKDLRISTYLDVFSSLGPTYYVPEKVRGIDFFNETQVKLNENSELRFRLQYDSKTDAITINPKTREKAIFFRTQYSARLEYVRFFGDYLRLKGRIESNLVNFMQNKPDEGGLAAYIECLLKPVENLSIIGRYAFYSTSSFESAVWQYEMVVPGYNHSPPLYGRGLRMFVSVKYHLAEILTLSAHYAMMRRFGEDELGSGYNEIMGNTDHRVFCQIDIDL
jgi:hypothetical protein